jgi:hypothetical protein
MLGVIDGRGALLHLWTIRREFGWACAGRCVRAVFTGERTTFLNLVYARAPRAPHDHHP